MELTEQNTEIKYINESGTKEWAQSNENCFAGCQHDCLYCYAKKMALRFGRIQTPEQWKNMVPAKQEILKKTYSKRTGRIMFPTTHDLLPEYTEIWSYKLRMMLIAGNEVLITTKPHFKTIQYICDHFQEFKDQIQFRFTIGSFENDVLLFWEPGAPSIEERMMAAQHAFHCKFKTSFSIEPLLTPSYIKMVSCLSLFTTESIWIGIMNYTPSDIGESNYYKQRVRETQSKKFLEILVKTYQHHPYVRFKSSIRKKLHLV